MITLTYPKPNEIVQASSIPWRVIAVAWTGSNKNTDVRFRLNGTIVATDTSAITTVENGVKHFNYQYSIPLKVAGDYIITAEEIDTKLQTVRSTASVSFTVIIMPGAVASTPPNTVAGDTLWKLDTSDRIVPKVADRTVRTKRLESNQIVLSKTGWDYNLSLDETNWLTTQRESADVSFGGLRVGNLQIHEALLFGSENFSLLGAELPAQNHWDGEYPWRLMGNWNAGPGALLIHRSQVADRSLSADSAKAIALSNAVILPLTVGVTGEVHYRLCGDLYRITIDCLINFDNEISKVLCQMPIDWFISEQIHIKDQNYAPSQIANFAHLHKDGSNALTVSLDRAVTGAVRCIGSWIV
jgi:hypothetical protein